MSAGAITIFDHALLNMLSATSLLAAPSFAMSLHASTWQPNMATDEVYADAAGEIAAGNGYTAGGNALTNVSLSLMNGTVRFICDPVKWVAAGGSIPKWRFGLIRAKGTYNGKVDPMLGFFIGEIGSDPGNPVPVDIPATTNTNSLMVAPSVDGLISASRLTT